jgi:hypothetical protein
MRLHAASLALACGFCAIAAADEVRYYEENGVTYRETRRVVRRPISEVVSQPVDRTVYREQYQTDYQDTVRVYSVPVTEYRWESYWQGRWNPFVQPYLAQRLVPYTRWETRTEKVRVPVVRRELVAELRQEQASVVAQRYVDEELISRVAVGPAAQHPAQLAQRPSHGGAASIGAESSSGGDQAWKPSQGATLR